MGVPVFVFLPQFGVVIILSEGDFFQTACARRRDVLVALYSRQNLCFHKLISKNCQQICQIFHPSPPETKWPFSLPINFNPLLWILRLVLKISKTYNRNRNKVRLRMGQNMRAIEQVVGNLENEQLISAQQSQRFLKDYQQNSPTISQLQSSLPTPSLPTFLKYYINSRYRDPTTKLCLSTTAIRESRKQISNNLQQVAINQLKHKLLSQYKSYEGIVRKVLRDVCQMVILERFWIIGGVFVGGVRDCLGVGEFGIVRKLGDDIVVYQSDIDCLIYVDNQHILYPEYLQMLQNPTQTQPSITTTPQHEIHWKFTLPSQSPSSQSSQYLIRLCLPQPQSPKKQHYLLLLQQPAIQQKLKAIFVSYISYFHPNTNKQDVGKKQASFIRKLGQQICFIFYVVQTGYLLKQEFIKLEMSALLNLQYQYKPISALEYLQTSGNQSSPYSLRQPTISQLQKSQKKLQKILSSLQSYSQKISKNKVILDFNRYSQLQFSFIHSQHPLHFKLASCWQQNRIKIIDVMGDNAVVMKRLGHIARNQEKCGVGEERVGDMVVRIWINSMSIFDGLMIQYDQDEKEPSFSDHTVDVREERYLTSKIQEKLVKDLEREDPNLKTLGWLALFMKEHTSTSIQKQQPKWLVTDIQRIQGIQNPNFNILPLPQKQLPKWVWNILKTNTTFNILTTQPQTSQKFTNFLNQLIYNYTANHNQFHNFYHAVNVLHTCYVFTGVRAVEDFLGNLEIFGVMVSGLGHGLGHTGYTNHFEVNALSQRALTYNDISPLQHHSCSKLFKILKHDSNNFLNSLQHPQFQRLKQNIITNILNTDFSKQSELLTNFDKWTKLQKQQAIIQYHVLTSAIVAASCYGGFCKEFKVASEWRNLVKGEFLKQGDMERKLGIIGPDVDVVAQWVKTDLTNMQTIVLPLYQRICDFSHGNSSVQQLAQNLRRNIGEWQSQNAKQVAK